MFTFRAEKNSLSVLAADCLASGAVGSYQAQFEFSDDWTGISKIAVFRADGTVRSILLDETGKCEIPWEVLEYYGHRLYTGVYGVRNDITVMTTIWKDCGKIREGASSGESSRPPAPELWRQELRNKQDKLSGQPGQVVGFDASGSATAQNLPSGGGEGSGQTYRFGHGLKQEGSMVSVNTVSDFDGDNTLPITAKAVQTTVGDVENVLKTI